MRLLAVETSTLAGGVALLDGERLVAEYLLDVGIAHSERLMAAVDRVLSDARWTMRDLAGLAVAVGPGSFTGLRIAVSTVKGLALALGLPIAAVPTLDAMAAAAAVGEPAGGGSARRAQGRGLCCAISLGGRGDATGLGVCWRWRPRRSPCA